MVAPPVATNNPLARPMSIKENGKRQMTPTPFSQITDVHDAIQNNRTNTPGLNSPIDITQFNYDDHWQEIEIDLDRVGIVEDRCSRIVLYLLPSRHLVLVSDFPLLVEQIRPASAIHRPLLSRESLKVV